MSRNSLCMIRKSFDDSANMDQSSSDDKIIAISTFVVKTLIQKGAADNKK